MGHKNWFSKNENFALLYIDEDCSTELFSLAKYRGHLSLPHFCTQIA